MGNDDRLTINFIQDKKMRTDFHEKIRKFFDILNSETLSEESPKKLVIFVDRNKTSLNKKRRMLPDQNKKYLYCSMLKRNIDTVMAVNYVAKQLHRSIKTIRFAGNKDKRGITTQKISCFNTVPEEITKLTRAKFWDKRIQIDNFEFRENELRLGMLKGNQFSVVLRFINIDDDDLYPSLKSLAENGFINYFGMQRFGVSATPTHKVGLYVIRKQWKNVVLNILNTTFINEILTEIKVEQDAILDNLDQVLNKVPRYLTEHKLLSTLKKQGKNAFQNAFKSLNKQLQVLYPHAYQSYIWNLTVSERIRMNKSGLLIGDIVRKRTSLASDFAEDVAGDDGEIVEGEEDENANENENSSQKKGNVNDAADKSNV